MKVLVLLVLLFGATQFAAAQDTSVGSAKRSAAGPAPVRARRPSRPIVIPQQFEAPQEAYASFPDHGAAASAAPSACQLRLAKIALFQALPALAGPGECGAVDLVMLASVILSGRAKVAITPPATLRCTMAEEVAKWVREDVAPAALKLGAALHGVDEAGAYECRGRNRVRGAMLSEHGRANALDVRALRLADRRVVALTDANIAADWREGLRASACARFTTVLGPGSDGNHEEHIHLDLAERHGGYRMCEWDVHVPVAAAEAAAEADAGIAAPVPLPRPRPAVAAKAGTGMSSRHRDR